MYEDLIFSLIVVVIIVSVVGGIFFVVDILGDISEKKQCAILTEAYPQYKFVVGIQERCYVFIEEVNDWRSANDMRLIAELSPQ